MSEVTPTEQKPPFIMKEVMDSRSGEIFQVRYFLCTCGIYTPKGHPECIRMRREQDAAEQEEIRKKQCKEMFGQVLSKTEMERRMYPDSKVWGQESYNDQLKREAREKEQARLKVIRDRAERKRMLEQMKDDIKILERQIIRDNEEAAKEKAQGMEDVLPISKNELNVS